MRVFSKGSRFITAAFAKASTFNTMKLKDPVITFRRLRDTGLQAKSTTDQRWFKVQGITKALDSLACKRRPVGHNMISMDLFAKVVEDLNANPESSLEWVPEYVRNLNAPESSSEGAVLREALLELFRAKALSPRACRRLWDRSRLSAAIGTAVDAQCKDVFNGKKTESEVGPVSRLILTQLKALRLTPICAGLKVAGVPTPDRFSEPGAYRYHNGCTRGCRSISADGGFFTEVDLVAHDTVKGNVALLELKTRSSDILDRHTLWRYNTQLWLTWVMFSLTYPSMAERSAAYLVIIRPGTNQVTIRNCLRPTISRSMRDKFPWLNCFCRQVLECLAPMCVNMRVESRSGSAGSSWIDPNDLCYRNELFNLEKRKEGCEKQTEK